MPHDGRTDDIVSDHGSPPLRFFATEAAITHLQSVSHSGDADAGHDLSSDLESRRSGRKDVDEPKFLEYVPQIREHYT